MKECQQAGLGPEHFTQWPDAWNFLEKHHRQFGRIPTRQTLENRFPRMSFPRGQQGEVEFLIGEVKSQWLYDQVSELLQQTVQLMTSPDHTVQEALHHLQAHGQAIQLVHGTNQKDLNLLTDGQSQVLDHAIRRIKAHHDPNLSGLRTGFSEFDQTTGGLDETEFLVLLARVTQGKSWGLLYMAATALMQGKNVLYFPLEMSQAQVAFRLHVILQDHFLKKYPAEMANLKPFLNKSLTSGSGYDLKSYKEFLELVGTKLPGSFIVSEPPAKLKPSHVSHKITLHKPDACYIDYLTLMEPDGMMGRGTEDWQAVKRLTSDLKCIAMSQKTPIITAAQASRQAVHRKGPPELEEIAFGDAIAHDADRVLSIKQLSRRVTVWLTIKNRHVDSRVQGYLEHHWNQGKIREISHDRAMELLQEDSDQGQLVSERNHQ